MDIVMVNMENNENPKILRESIGNVAKELFSHYGFKKTSMDDIAGKARVAKGTIYNYFKNKDDLIRYVVWNEWETLVSDIRKGISNLESPQRKLREMYIIKIKYYKELRLLHSLTYEKMAELLPIVEKEIKEFKGQQMDIVREILEEGVKRSCFRSMDVFAAAKAISCAMKGLEMEWAFGIDVEEAIVDADNMLEILFVGLEKRPKE